MPRPRICRRIGFCPGITYFKPAGVRMMNLNEVVLTLDEFEAIRLKDHESMDQEEAAKKMNISQPTFHRLINSARKKVADALANGKAIRLEGGVYKMVQTQPQAGTGGMGGRGFGRGGRMHGRGFQQDAACVCPSCGFHVPKERGVPCTSVRCPKCNSMMIRKN